MNFRKDRPIVMGQIQVEKNVGGIAGLCVIQPAVHGDARGYFMETYNERDMHEAAEKFSKWLSICSPGLRRTASGTA